MARILVVDDDPSILSLERLLLTEQGHEVLLADSARAGLSILGLYHVDLIIVDVMMPDLNGFQFVNLAKSNPRLFDAPVAFLTSKNNKRDIMRARELGADFYIMKPIDRSDFLKKIASFFLKNPPKKHAQFEFQRPQSAEAKICQSVQVTVISEVGVEILTEAKIEVDQVLELSASVFQEIPLKHPLLRVISVKTEGHGLTRARLMFVDCDGDCIKRIQRWISYNMLKPRPRD